MRSDQVHPKTLNLTFYRKLHICHFKPISLINNNKAHFVPFIIDVEVVISASVLVVVSIAEVICIAEVLVVHSPSEVPCAKHVLCV